MNRKSSQGSIPKQETAASAQPSKGRKILSDEERLQQKIKTRPELQSILQGFDQLLKLLENPGADKSLLLKTLKTNVEDKFETHSTNAVREIMGDYLALKGFAERIYDLYEFLVTATDANVITSSLLQKHKESIEMMLMVEMRKMLWTCSDNSPLLAERIANTNLFKYLLADVKAISKTLPNIADDDLAFDTAIGILYNCSQNHVTRSRYRELKAVDELMPFLKAKSTKVKLTTLLLLSHIVDESKNKSLTADASVFDFLIDMIKKSWEDVDHRCYQGNTYFSARELLSGLTALAKNDSNKRLLMQKGVLEPLEKILKGGSEAEQVEALNCIRELSFDDSNKSVLNANQEVMKVLNDKADSTNKQIAETAQRTRWGLAAKKVAEHNLQRKQSVLTFNKASPGHVMLSYCWNDQKIVLQIYEKLKSEGFRLWIDVDDMAGSTLGAMASAVENASVVIIFVSEPYFLSQNCRQEAEYTYKLKKQMAPVMLQPQEKYTPSGWLGIMLGTKLYFDFSREKNFQQKTKELVKELGNNGRITEEDEKSMALAPSNGPVNTTHRVSVTGEGGDRKRVGGWTNKDVVEWLKTNNMYQYSALRNLTGEELLFLQNLSQQAPEFFYSYLERNLKLKSLKDLMTFTKALNML